MDIPVLQIQAADFAGPVYGTHQANTVKGFHNIYEINKKFRKKNNIFITRD
jgi:hypothetical protein